MNTIQNNHFFRNRFGHFRAGWRILFCIALSLLCFLPVAGLLKIWDLLTPDKSGAVDSAQFYSTVNILFYMGLNIALVLGSWLTLRWIDKRPYALLGFDLKWNAFKDYGMGFMLGFLNFIGIYIILWATGWVDITPSMIHTQVLKKVLVYFIAFNAAAIFEELINRGYLFQALVEGTKPWIATAFISLAFVAGHAANKGFAWNNAVFFLVHGVLYCLLYLQTRSIWVPAGFHVAWNWTQGSIFGMNVSGIEIQNSIFISQSKGPVLLTGGEFGVESSVISIAVSIMLIVILIKLKWLKPDKVRSELWQKYPGGFGLEPECNQK